MELTQDEIRQAIELADNFYISYAQDRYVDWVRVADSSLHTGKAWHSDELPQVILDALAAQLCRQVDSPENQRWVTVRDFCSFIQDDGEQWTSRGADRTTNTIRVVIESGVLT